MTQFSFRWLARVSPLLLALAAILVTASGCSSPPTTEKPVPVACADCNIILISMDTVRADHVGAYGYRRPTTPNVDAFAARGTLFENAISQSSWTRPAHMSIFTGLHPAEHGMVALKDRRRLGDAVPTLAGVLRERGYTTAAFTGGVNVAAAFGFDQGFDTYRTNGKYFRDNLEDTKYWLQQNGSKKMFLFWHGYDAHTPYLTDAVDRNALGLAEDPPKRALRKSCRKVGDLSRMRRHVAEYDGAIHRADRYVGKFLRHLEEIGVLENSIVVLLSDHGEEFLEHGRCFHLSTLYHEVLHVPFILVGGGIPIKRINTMVPASVSVAATILELVGIVDHPIPGPSLAGLIQGTHEAQPADFSVVSETHRALDMGNGEGHLRSLTTRGGKFVHWITQERSAFFATAADPGEQQPIVDGPDHAALAQALEQWSSAHVPKPGEEAAEEPMAADPELERQLQALGYSE